MKTDKTTPPDLQRLDLLLEDVERHLLSVYGKTVADFESDPIQDEGWCLYCEIKKERERLLKFRNNDQNETNKLLPEIDQAAYEQIREQANRLYCKAQRGYRGQQVTIHDTHSYWIMIATREFFTTNNQG